MNCRPSCAACCIAPYIISPLLGKPAGVPCVQFDESLRCRVFGRPERPAF